MIQKSNSPVPASTMFGVDDEVYELYNEKMSHANAAAFCIEWEASLVSLQGDMNQLLASMACKVSLSKCWAAGKEEAGCNSILGSNFATTDCESKLPFVCFRE
eukprot:gene14437-20444_t